MALCEVCLDFQLDHVSRLERRHWRIRVKDDLTLEYCLDFASPDLRRSSENGCMTCQIVKGGLSLFSDNLHFFDDKRPYQGHFVLQDNCPLEVEILTVKSDRKLTIRLQYYSLDEGCEIPRCFGVAREVPSEISVEGRTRIIKAWLDECCSSHDACVHGKRDETSFPTRLLDLRSQPEHGWSILLVDSISLNGQTSRYATLSHCWGTAEVIQTTKSTLARRQFCIQWSELPRTFQEVITIVRALGVRYLWIDSLCIIQDDKLDWKRESARMASIYSNSFINIAATGASDSSSGCFWPRSIKHVSQSFYTTSFAISTGCGPTVYVRPSFDSIHYRYSAQSTNGAKLFDTETVPLLSRAWVFQERQLAPRTLHFHPSEMIMECRSKYFCECTGLDTVVSRSSRARKGSLDLKSLDYSGVLDHWLNVVEQFSKLRLTFESDRLLALLGVATVFQQRLSCGYVAGLWDVDITRGLLWNATRPRATQPPENTRWEHNPYAPTWSWASLILHTEGTAIIFPAFHDDNFKPDDHFSYLGTDMPLIVTESNQKDDFAIRIRSMCMSAILSYPNNIAFPEKKVNEVIFDQDRDGMIWICTVSMHQDVTWSMDKSLPIEEGAMVNCSLLGTTEDKDWSSGETDTYLCTLVSKPSIRIPGGWERVGVLNLQKSLGLFEDALEVTLQLV
ncbi:hypothetical protein BP5796_09254 [Coleophoma crateriformis]|uniref:Heterokaryon incompatibility domain-containing protein n=1 Tax=Coleophoma crateriformis TaxID=565419 RepID=A0A3D8R3J7_9HELO|nr:hypothetical protein BP5796_09254 [Coleophoma crateriformis]